MDPRILIQRVEDQQEPVKKLLSKPKREIDKKFFIAEGSSSFRMKISKKKQKINSKILLLFKKIQDPGPGFASASELNGS